MSHKDSIYPSDWMKIAEKDFDRVEFLLKAHDTGFFLQQSVEKFLKAFLISKGWKLKRIHDLEPLLNEVLLFDASLEAYRFVLQKISGFYFIELYPIILDTGITEEDIKQAFTEVKGLIEKIRSYFNK
ncbi:MAG: hypothetical protein A2V93_05885 [Ignavibacteria bacterium RBG_16_34_14]|nr:MAG: hypothetical protein A2V93_05885 [Ignavibacteria bacterium RBG_16_34_14]